MVDGGLIGRVAQQIQIVDAVENTAVDGSTTAWRFLMTMTLRLITGRIQDRMVGRVSKRMPSTRSLMRLVPTVTVLAWCLMASTGRDMS
jgi:hypothetical protein